MIVAIYTGIAVLVTVLLSLTITRRTTLEGLQTQNEIADKYMMIVTAVYGIFLAFVITNL